ncbi:hypothetical protein PA598K_01961 [Paenibacillus sp. 598K]|uniref:CD3324 family protein n=1 Tax=Paenibacillus sp. 598K TaxID=1117987 RepID=UPI000FF92A7C|nr:CD3324 family protein [Paenibacillus sp. 598K]GBF73653.1 hypothetical protein PA598K_01961 [Paenibacillus sp. 598K]
MKYENAGDILPEALLREVQQYAAGKLLYIPKGADKKAWGEASGYREQLIRRNRMIRNKYAHGMTVSELADQYCLSLDSIKKIVYAKKSEHHLTYASTVASAVAYARAGLLEEWVECCRSLTLPARAVPEVETSLTRYIGVVKFPIRLIQREQEEAGAERQTTGARDRSEHPPLLISYSGGQFCCPEQRELLGALRASKVNAFPSIVMMEGNEDYKRFMTYYGTVLFFVDAE